MACVYWFCWYGCTSCYVPDVCRQLRRQVCIGRRAVFSSEFWTFFHEPFVSGRHFQQSGRCASGFFGALDDEEFFVVEGVGGGLVARSLDSQVTCRQWVSVTVASSSQLTVEYVSQTTTTTTTTTTTVVDRFAFLFFTSDLSVGSMWSARCAEDAGSFGTND